MTEIIINNFYLTRNLPKVIYNMFFNYEQLKGPKGAIMFDKINFLACKCGIERTSRIVGGTEVNPVRLYIYYLIKTEFFPHRKTNILGWLLFWFPYLIIKPRAVEGPWWLLNTSSLLPTVCSILNWQSATHK